MMYKLTKRIHRLTRTVRKLRAELQQKIAAAAKEEQDYERQLSDANLAVEEDRKTLQAQLLKDAAVGTDAKKIADQHQLFDRYAQAQTTASQQKAKLDAARDTREGLQKQLRTLLHNNTKSHIAAVEIQQKTEVLEGSGNEAVSNQNMIQRLKLQLVAAQHVEHQLREQLTAALEIKRRLLQELSTTLKQAEHLRDSVENQDKLASELSESQQHALAKAHDTAMATHKTRMELLTQVTSLQAKIEKLQKTIDTSDARLQEIQ